MGRERVLIAEDSITQAEALRSILEAEDFDVEVVRDGRSALARARQGAFDAVLTDATMPGLEGPALCRLLRADPTTRDTVVVMLTAHQDPAVLLEALNAGVDGWFLKPFEVDEVVAGVRRLIARSAGRRRVCELVGMLRPRLEALSGACDPAALAALAELVTELEARALEG